VRPFKFVAVWRQASTPKSMRNMTAKLKDILDLLEEIAPSKLAESWDNPGLQVGSYSQEITNILVALDPTMKSLHLASDRGAQLLLTHHPLIFRPVSRLEAHTFPGNVIVEAVRNQTSVVAIHTNLDAAQGGINDILANLLGLQDVHVLERKNEDAESGLGRIGTLPQAVSLSDLAKDIKKVLGAERLAIISEGNPMVHHLAVVGGAGGNLVSLASQRGADLLLTGDVGHHQALEAKSLGIALIDSGHFHMEKTAFGIFGRHLRDELVFRGWEITVEVDEGEVDPLEYSGQQ